MKMVKNALGFLLAFLMIGAGILHFKDPLPFVKIVPDFLPYPLALVYISGFFEILGGGGLLVPSARRYAAWGLVALYIAVFPANIHMAVHHLPFGDGPTPDWILWARLPLQLVLIFWAGWYTRDPKR